MNTVIPPPEMYQIIFTLNLTIVPHNDLFKLHEYATLFSIYSTCAYFRNVNTFHFEVKL